MYFRIGFLRAPGRRRDIPPRVIGCPPALCVRASNTAAAQPCDVRRKLDRTAKPAGPIHLALALRHHQTRRVLVQRAWSLEKQPRPDLGAYRPEGKAMYGSFLGDFYLMRNHGPRGSLFRIGTGLTHSITARSGRGPQRQNWRRSGLPTRCIHQFETWLPRQNAPTAVVMECLLRFACPCGWIRSSTSPVAKGRSR